MATVLICEKPDAAKKIAFALADDKVKQIKTESGIVYFSFKRDGKELMTVPAVGHVFMLKDVSKLGWTYPIFDVDWAPVYEINKKAMHTKKYIQAIEEVVKLGKDFIIATDLDEEGSVIGYNILRFLAKQKDGKRMCFSTLTKPDLVEAYKNLLPHLDFGRIESGLTRHELDFLWGVNVSRALTLSIKNAGKKLSYYVISAGRVQTPMLYFLIKREKEINKFVSTPFWELEADLITTPAVTCYHSKGRFLDEKIVKDMLKKCADEPAIVDKTETKNVEKNPPTPFDLTSLQTEAYRYFGYSPKRTVAIAQNLYTAGYISYPRTSSQKLPPQIGYHDILKNLGKIKAYEKFCKELLSEKELKPNEGTKTDAAHPAVYPTSETPDVKKLNTEEKKLYDLIARRFLATFGKPAKRESTQILFAISDEIFKATGSKTLEPNWMEYYGPYAKLEEVELPQLRSGDKIDVKDLRKLDKETQPPARYSQGSIVKELEKQNLGTKTTRATILQTLYDRGYISGKSIEVTKLGMQVGETLANYVPELVSEKLTRSFEKDMEKVGKEEVKRENVIKKARIVIKKVSKEFHENESKVGIALEKAIIEMKNQQQMLGKCPNCKEGNLKVLFSPFTKKRFVGCSSYNRCAKCGFTKTACKCKCLICGGEKGKCKCSWKEKVWNPSCGTGYPLPRFGFIESSEKVCDECKSPIIKVIRKGARPFTMCLDPKCKTKVDWIKTPKELEKAKEKAEASENNEETETKIVKKKAK